MSDTELPCEPNEVLRVCLQAVERFPKAYHHHTRQMVLKCKDDPKWHNNGDIRLRMAKLFHTITDPLPKGK